MAASPELVLGALFGISVFISLWGAAKLRPDVRFRGRFGGLGFDFTVSKTTGLITWPLMCGAIAWVASAIEVTDSSSFLFVLGAVGILIVIMGQASAIRRAQTH